MSPLRFFILMARGLVVNLDSRLSVTFIVSPINIHSFHNKKYQFTIKFPKKTLQLINPSWWTWVCFVKLVLYVDFRIVEPIATSPELHSIKGGTQTAPHKPPLLHYIILDDFRRVFISNNYAISSYVHQKQFVLELFSPQLFIKCTQYWVIYTLFLIATAEESALHTRVCTIK